MKICLDPRSATSRPILMFVHDQQCLADFRQIDLVTAGETSSRWDQSSVVHHAPLLNDGDLVLTQAPTILRYLAEQCAPSTYPDAARLRAPIDDVLDWLTLQSAEIAENFLSHMTAPEPKPRSPFLYGDGESASWSLYPILEKMEKDLLSSDRMFLCGGQITIADYMAVGSLGLAQESGFNSMPWPLLRAWIRAMMARPCWGAVHFAVAGPAAKRAQRCAVAKWA